MAKSKRRPKKLRRRGTQSLIISILAAIFVVAVLAISLRPKEVSSNQLPTETVKIASEDDTVLIPTPSRIVARGESLKSVSFTYVKWPKSRLSDNYVRDVELYKTSYAMVQLPKFLPIPTSAISSEQVDANAVVEGIPEGMRAITVRVDAESAVEGWARSGNYVDVIVIRASKRDTGLEAKVIAENVKILSAGRSATPLTGHDRAPKAPTTVTLLVSQEQALTVKASSAIGKLTFALRGSGDANPTHSLAMNANRFIGGEKGEIRTQKANGFRGVARGPNGKIYVLGSKDRWVRAEKPKSDDALMGARARLNSLTETPEETSKEVKETRE